MTPRDGTVVAGDMEADGEVNHAAAYQAEDLDLAEDYFEGDRGPRP